MGVVHKLSSWPLFRAENSCIFRGEKAEYRSADTARGAYVMAGAC